MTFDEHQSPGGQDAPAAQKVAWGQERRLQFIDFRLRWEGKLNRTDLMDYFGVSTPQASLDISRYKQLAPDNLDYDRSSKTYLAKPEFQAKYERSSVQRYLAETLALDAGLLGADATFIRGEPPVATVASPLRAFDDKTVETVVRAIRQKHTLNVNYQSMNSAEPAWRLLSPHALVFDGFRWHMRAYCHKRGNYRDFVLARIVGLEDAGVSPSDLPVDDKWQRTVVLILAAHPGLPKGSQKAIELDYGMSNGEAHLVCRHALLYYTLRRLSLDSEQQKDASAQQIILKNRLELQPLISALTSN